MALPIQPWIQRSIKAMFTQGRKDPVNAKGSLSKGNIVTVLWDAEDILLVGFLEGKEDSNICILWKCFEKISYNF